MTFAGSPDRVESRLVPEAGFELDTFAISGFPRKPSLALLRALWRAGEGAVRVPGDPAAAAARRRPRRRRLRRRARWCSPRGSRGIPAALTEADAHLGLANRLAAPFAVEALPRLRDPGARRRRRSRSSAGRSRVAHLGASRAEARARFGLGRDEPVVAVFGALAGATSLNEMAVAAWGDDGPAVLHVSGERDFAALAARVHRAGLRADAADRPLRRRARGGRRRRLARRRHRVGARRRGDAVDPRPVPARDRRPPDAQRPPLRAGRRRGRRARTPRSARCPALVDELLADPERLAAMRAAMLSMARVDAADRIAEGLIALARR